MSVDIKIVETYDQEVFQALVKENLESSGVFIREWDYQGVGEETHQNKHYKINVAAFDNNRMIGLSWGCAASKHRFVMHMSLVHPDYRGQGIYSKMLKMMLDETERFNEVDSFHQLFNNHIIAIKLRHGFHIIGIDQSIVVGPRVRLRYFHNQKLLELMKFRVGLVEDPRAKWSSSML